MNPERLHQVEELYHAARARQPEDRAELLAHADPELRSEVESLLAQNGESPFDHPAMEVAANLLEDSSAEQLAVGAQLGPYRIESSIGAGGMGQVYKARDTRLGRAVAIKVSSKQFNARFEREARAISALNHPHICTLYDVGPDYLVMELVEGETLAARLKKGPLPLDQVLRYGIEIAGALDQAHRNGVIHRDLKPGNIMITKLGAKVLDFGLAKTTGESVTASNVVMGTPGYMAPEQLRGKACDARTDIYALGLLLREMATGKNSESLEKLPPQFAHVVERCLAQDPEGRWQAVSDIKEELRWIAQADSQPGSPVVVRHTKRERLAWATAAVVVLVGLILGVVKFRQTPVEREAIRFSIPPPERATFDGPVAISPDGRRLAAVVSSTESGTSIWVRRMDSSLMQPHPGTEAGDHPFWSPDSRFIAFFSNGKLKKIEASGGPAQTLCDAPDGARGTWNRNGVIVFAGESGLLYRVSAEGGPASAVTTLDRAHNEDFHAWPHFLPDGRHFLYLSISKDLQSDAIYVGSLNSNDRQRLVSSHWMPAYARAGDGHGGYLLFLHEGTLMAQSFDPDRLTLSGELLPVAEKAGSANPIEIAFFSVSDNGVLVYRRTDDYSNRQLAWYGRSGRPIEGVDQPGQGIFPSLSPDGKRLAVARQAPQTEGLNIWLLELARKTASRFTFRGTTNFAPVWSPDGSRIVFAANLGTNTADLYQKFSSGDKEEELLLKSSYNKWPWDWSRDGRFISYTSGGTMKEDLWILPLDGDRKPFVFLQTPFAELGGMFSPDGKWIAYTSDDSGRWEVYVKSFNQRLPSQDAGALGRLQISTTGGFQPVWRRDGKELFYISSDGKLMAVDVSTGSHVTVGSPKVLFQARGEGTSARCNNCEAAFSGQAAPHEYAATADGQRFLINTVVAGETPITVMVNWAARLKR